VYSCSGLQAEGAHMSSRGGIWGRGGRGGNGSGGVQARGGERGRGRGRGRGGLVHGELGTRWVELLSGTMSVEESVAA